MTSIDALVRRRDMPDDEVPSETAAPVLARPVHAGVPGRVRWHVHGLRGDPTLKTLLEAGLAELPGLDAATASAETGNLLTLFDASVSPDQIGRQIAAVVRGELAPASGAAGAEPDWHARPAAALTTALGTSETRGLTETAARARLAEHGANALPPPKSRSALAIFLGQFRTLPVGMLVAAGAFSLLTGGLVEAAAILAVVGFNGVLGTAIEGRSERTLSSLGTAGHEPVEVIRDARPARIGAEAVVPGDLITLVRGTVVPADARVLSACDLRVAEAMLTGESLPVAKRAEQVAPTAALADRASMVYRGTAATAGSGTAIVVATGPRTEMGRIQRLVGSVSAPQTPMQRQLDQLGRQLVWASLAACGAVMGVGALRGIALFQIVRSAVSLAVAAIPEGLPMVATTTLALGIEDMRKRGVLVRRLDAVESLASVGVVCFDKTGTLTLNQMRVAEVASGGGRFRTGPDGALLDADGQPVAVGTDPIPGNPLAWLLRVGVLCSDAGLEERAGQLLPTGSATEGALVRLALDAGLDVAALRQAHPRVAVRHRAAAYRFMATAHRSPADEGVLIAAKGSPAEVLDLCAWELRDGVRQPLSAQRRAAIARVNDAMASEALRVLGFAFANAPPEAPPTGNGEGPAVPVTGLTWVGLAGMADPVRPGMATLVCSLHEAGLRTVMMTGDQVATARAVAGRLRLAGEGEAEVIDMAEVGSLSADELAAAARSAHVFARVSPAQKLLLVRALQKGGERVAMTGDGINDSPALKAADVGFAMGGEASSGAAREMADVVLQTDDVAALAVAVERGRTTYVNVRKSIRYLLATNLSEILVVLGGTILGFAEPLTAMQLLWINLVGDVLPGLGLAFEPPEPGLMQRRPEDGARAIVERRDLGQLGAHGGVIAAGSLAALGWGTLRHGSGPEARTMAFGSLVTAQILHALTARSDRHGPLTGEPVPLQPNRPLTRLLLASAALQAAGLFVPGVRGALGVVTLGPLDLAATAAGGLLPYVANEVLKAARPMPPAAPEAA